MKTFFVQHLGSETRGTHYGSSFNGAFKKEAMNIEELVEDLKANSFVNHERVKYKIYEVITSEVVTVVTEEKKIIKIERG